MTVQPTLKPENAAGRVWDVVVIGAGPAGAMSAMLLARSRAGVLLIDRKAFPRYKVCGGYLNARAIAALGRAGLAREIQGAGALPISELRIHRGGSVATIPLPAGFTVSRARLDAELVRAAIESGASFLPETTAAVAAPSGPPAAADVRGVRLRHRNSSTLEISARALVVADGLGHPSLREGAGAEDRIATRSRVGLGCVLDGGAARIKPNAIAMAVGRRGYVGLARTTDGHVNAAAALDAAALSAPGGAGDALSTLVRASGLDVDAAALRRADWHGTPPLSRATARPAGHRLFMVGDAAGYVEPFTGEGMAWALTGAEALAPFVMKAVSGWHPSLAAGWIEAHRSAIVREQRWCRAIASVLRRPWLVTAAVSLLQHRPGLARPVTAHLSPPMPRA